MAVGDVYKLTERKTLLGQQIQNHYFFRLKTSPDPTSSGALALANDVKEKFRASFVTSLAYREWLFEQVYGGTVTYLQPQCKRAGGISFAGAYTGTLVGTNAADPLTTQLALVSTIKTGLAGRTKRGRVYWSGYAEDSVTAGAWTASFLSALAAQWATFMGVYGPSGTDPTWQYGVWSQITATGCKDDPSTVSSTPIVFASPSPANAWTGATEIVVRPVVYTQRRRTVGVGQ